MRYRSFKSCFSLSGFHEKKIKNAPLLSVILSVVFSGRRGFFLFSPPFFPFLIRPAGNPVRIPPGNRIQAKRIRQCPHRFRQDKTNSCSPQADKSSRIERRPSPPRHFSRTQPEGRFRASAGAPARNRAQKRPCPPRPSGTSRRTGGTRRHAPIVCR